MAMHAYLMGPAGEKRDLEKGGPHWDNMVQSGTIAIYQPISPAKVKLELLAVER